MQHNDEQTESSPSGPVWILSARDAAIGDKVITPGEVITLGRQSGCDIVIPDRYVSRRHAEVFVRDDQLFVRDLQSRYGTLVNGEPVTERALQPGDEIRLDKAVFAAQQLGVTAQDAVQELPVEVERHVENDGPMLVGMSPAFRDRQFALQPGKMIIGRKPNADIRLDEEQVSDVHAQIVGEGARWRLINILSAHGTFVNGRKIQAAWLRSGDVVRFGSVDLQFVDGKKSTGARIEASASAPGKYRLAWMGLAVLIVVMILVLAWLAFR